MKATVKVALPGYTGKSDDMSYYFNSKLNRMIARRIVKPSFVPSHDNFVKINSMPKRIGLSEKWKDDCNRYITAYNAFYRRKGKALLSWPSVWLKMMMAQLATNPELDFSTLNREDIMEQNLPCRSIATAIETGLILKVRDPHRFTQLI